MVHSLVESSVRYLVLRLERLLVGLLALVPADLSVSLLAGQLVPHWALHSERLLVVLWEQLWADLLAPRLVAVSESPWDTEFHPDPAVALSAYS